VDIYSRFVKTLPSALTPFVRSDVSGALLAETLGRPDAEFSLAELARLTGAGTSVVHKEVGRLVSAGVLRDRSVGRNRMVRANQDHPLFALMRDLISATYGPVPVLRELLLAAPGVEAVYIYGSWAARRAGEPGEFPHDIDVLVVGSAPQRELADIARAASERAGIDVNVSRVSLEEWASSSPTPFLATVKDRPMIAISDGSSIG
jgi:predicted nucleotidyltransferase